MKKISTNEVIKLAEKVGVFVFEDLSLVIGKGPFTIPLECCDFLQEPPYTNFYDKELVEKYIALIIKTYKEYIK